MKIKVTLDEVEALMDYYVKQASNLKKVDEHSSEMNHVKMRLGYWSKIKKEFAKEEN